MLFPKSLQPSVYLPEYSLPFRIISKNIRDQSILINPIPVKLYQSLGNFGNDLSFIKQTG